MAIDESKLNEFMGKFVSELGAVMHAATVVVGDKLGLYKTLAERPCSAEDLANRTETDPRYLREWLSCQAASGYVQYEPASDTFRMSEEQKQEFVASCPTQVRRPLPCTLGGCCALAAANSGTDALTARGRRAGDGRRDRIWASTSV